MASNKLSQSITGWERGIDKCFKALALFQAWFIVFLILFIVGRIAWSAFPAISQHNVQFVLGRQWNPNAGQFGILPEIVGTLSSALLAISIAAILGVSVAIFLSEHFVRYFTIAALTKVGFANNHKIFGFAELVEDILGKIIELLAAIPSVVYGLWGIFVVIPLIRPLCDVIHQKLGWIPLFSTPLSGPGVLPASIVLAIMILPTVSSIVRDSLLSVPTKLREASYAMGATRWETLKNVVLPTAKNGIWGGILLAMGRAVGETMALAMLMGNSNTISWSLFSPGNTLAALLANNFPEASKSQIPVLMYAALILLLMTLGINVVGVWVLQKSPLEARTAK
jgi:phosphate transport system permease protein